MTTAFPGQPAFTTLETATHRRPVNMHTSTLLKARDALLHQCESTQSSSLPRSLCARLRQTAGRVFFGCIGWSDFVYVPAAWLRWSDSLVIALRLPLPMRALFIRWLRARLARSSRNRLVPFPFALQRLLGANGDVWPRSSAHGCGGAHRHAPARYKILRRGRRFGRSRAGRYP